jgi:hypothetical protein
MVKRHLSVPHEFVVVTDRPQLFDGDRASIHAFRPDMRKHVPGTCFLKLTTFHPAFPFKRLLQIDLDTLIVGSIDHLVDRGEDLVMWRNPSRIPWDRPAVSGRPYYNTSLLLYRKNTRTELWSEFDPSNPLARDDQWWLSDRLGPDMPYWDGNDGVYRLGREDTPGSGVVGELPDNACIVTFPGSEGKWREPRIQAANPWIEQYLVA